MRAISLIALILLAGCRAAGPDPEVAALRAEVAGLKAAQAQASAPLAPELGQQMLELQIRHARLWQAGEARNWMLAQFQLAELREALEGVVEQNGDHAALQPQRLADILPAMMDPPLKQMQAAIDAQDGPGFDKAYDAVSASCTGCHAGAEHAFLVIQRPKTPVLDNLKATPGP